MSVKKVNVSANMSLTAMIILFCWLAGVVIANGFWAKFVAAVFPPYGLYLFVEKVLQVAGLI